MKNKNTTQAAIQVSKQQLSLFFSFFFSIKRTSKWCWDSRGKARAHPARIRTNNFSLAALYSASPCVLFLLPFLVWLIGCCERVILRHKAAKEGRNKNSPLWRNAATIMKAEKEMARDPLPVIAMLDTCLRLAALNHLETAMGWKCRHMRGGERERKRDGERGRG